MLLSKIDAILKSSGTPFLLVNSKVPVLSVKRLYIYIGNDFYKLWLDETMSYSCGYFAHTGTSLFEAQVAKVDRILNKLQLKEGMKLLDIGCGFLLKRAAQRYGVQGVGITLSEERYRSFSQDIEEGNLQGKLEVHQMDYRFYTLDVESLRRHYVRTLHCWRENFLKNRKREGVEPV